MSSSITLTAGVRQNLLSLQNTAELISQTQNRLATGKKVNSALDNPGSFFTSQSLNNRASDLNSLLDSIGQAQKTLAAADTGLTSLTKLVQSAKSIAQQARQAAQPTTNTFSKITLTGTVNGGQTQTITFGSAAGQVSTDAELNTALGNISGLTASVSGTTSSFVVASSSVQNNLTLAASTGVTTALGVSASVNQNGAL